MLESSAVRSLLQIVCCLVLCWGCREKQRPSQASSERKGPGAVEQRDTQAARPAHTTAYRFPAHERLVAIGDVHGDLAATRQALRLAGAIDDADRWVGGKLGLVQTGDQLDRGDQEREIVDLFESLAPQAEAAGGRVYAMNGNHETMNVQGDFRYVTDAGLAFGSVSPASPSSHSVPERFRERAAAFLPGGAYAKLLAKRPVVLVVGDSAFAHGGILPEHVSYGLDRINREVSEWMNGLASSVPAAVGSDTAPVWTRLYGGEESTKVCEVAGRVLSELGARRIVVGHTVQKAGITSICRDQVWRIDVGLSAYYGDRPVSVLEVVGEQARVLTGPG